jgi:hypothetical protein
MSISSALKSTVSALTGFAGNTTRAILGLSTVPAGKSPKNLNEINQAYSESLSSSTKILGAIFNQMQKARAEELSNRLNQENQTDTKKQQDDKFNEELIKALSIRRKPRKPKKEPTKKEEPSKKEPAKKEEPKPEEKKVDKTAQDKAAKDKADKEAAAAKDKANQEKSAKDKADREAASAKDKADKESAAAKDKSDKESAAARKKVEAETQAAKKTAEKVPTKEVPKEAVKPPTKEAPKELPKPSAEKVAPTVSKPVSTAGKVAAGVAAAGAFAGLTFAQRAQAAGSGFKKLGLTNDNAIAGILATAAKETNLGEKNTEAGPLAYKNTWRNMESGKNSIPKDKYDLLIKKFPGTPKNGPGAGTAYLNFTFSKNWPAEKWKNLIDDPDSSEFFKAVGYSGGEKYLGRGLIQVTHEHGYKYVGDLLGIDLLNKPGLVAEDRDINIAASLAYMGLSVGQFPFKGNFTKEQLQKYYQKGIDRLNSVKDFKEGLETAVSNVFSGSIGLGGHEKLKSKDIYLSNYKASEAKSGEVLSALSMENKNLKDSLAPQNQTIVNNTMTPSSEPEADIVVRGTKKDDRSALQRKTQ